jgi:hypothetical protein
MSRPRCFGIFQLHSLVLEVFHSLESTNKDPPACLYCELFQSALRSRTSIGLSGRLSQRFHHQTTAFPLSNMSLSTCHRDISYVELRGRSIGKRLGGETGSSSESSPVSSVIFKYYSRSTAFVTRTLRCFPNQPNATVLVR